MSSVKRPDAEKLRTRRIIATATLTVAAIVLLVLSDASAPVRATPPAEGPSVEAVETQVPSDPAEAKAAPADQAPGAPAAPQQNPDDPTGEKKVQTASTARPVRPQEE